MGAGVKAADFPRRNRIISGLSRGWSLVEGGIALWLADHAPGSGDRRGVRGAGITARPTRAGGNDLLRQGATLVEDADDVQRVLEALPGFAEAEPVARARVTGSTPAPPEVGGDALHALLDTLLSHTPTSINVLAREAGAPVSAVLAALTELALAGRVELTPGNLAVRL